jgi:hypothetical protein
MAYQKLQVSRALDVIKSDNANIPSPALIVQGVNNSVVANELEDTDVNFQALNVAIGDVVYNITDGLAATVTKVVDSTRLLLNADIFTGTSKTYKLYSQNQNNEACVLYIGSGGNLRVETHAGDDIIFYNVLGGTFLPVQVSKVFSTSTTASNIVALW